MTKKKKSSTKKKLDFDINAFGNGILRFFEILFKFILDILKILPEFLKGVLWTLMLALLTALIAIIALYLTMSAFGLKDSPAFQEYRDFMIRELMIEHTLEIENISESI
jgi:hypothetical protein